MKSRGKLQGYITILQLSADMWTEALKMRTEILYHADISLVITMLHLKPGHVVVESGTGSGSLSTQIARSIAPHGHVHTFEYNHERVKAAKDDFHNIGLDQLITCRQRDVCTQGFPVIEGVYASLLSVIVQFIHHKLNIH